MKDLFIKYWDIIGGVFTGLLVSFMTKFRLEKVQLIYSIIILILVSIGVLKIIKQSIEKNKKEKTRKRNLIDDIVDGQKPVKAIHLAQEPTKDGERLGKLFIDLYKGARKIMNKFKVFFDKFKGYILTITLTILSIVEMFGGFINEAAGGVLTIKGVEVLPIISLICAVIVGCISNGWSKDQMEKIKALFSKSNTNELVQQEIKKTIKADEAKLKEFNKILATKQTELDNLNSQLTTAKNTHEAKQEMAAMVPQLATNEDVQLAANEIVNIEAAIVNKTNEVDETKKSIDNLTTAIAALKSQL